ncbi:MAG TPA: glycine betaine ABC transporter substrate-binding protein [Candidatus Acidoferrales bacterium]|nr:glycine betaine ABC transporter substrate-binding protein [Candidatus Acidoferrales bacterium]
MKASRCACLLLCVALGLLSCGTERRDTIIIGSKNFTEQAILGELLAQHLEARTHLRIVRRFFLVGTYICQQALLAGRIDTYVEYTGTALTAILKEPVVSDPKKARERVREEYLRRFHLEVLPPLGFNNTFAMVIRGEDARRLGIHTLSEAAPYAGQWRAGFGYEFTSRPDGYPGLASTYGLHFAGQPRVMDFGLMYRSLLDKQIDIVDGNSTDGILVAHDLTILQDDKHYFPPYEAVPIVRHETLEQHPEVRAALIELAGKISDAEMQKLNYAVDAEHADVATVVRNFLHNKAID